MTGLLSAAGNAFLLAASANDRQIQETLDRARLLETLGYVLAGLGILVILAGIPIQIYLDRRKKARKAAEAEARQATPGGGPDTRGER